MAFKVKIVDTNLNEHIHLINDDSCILIDEKCSGQYKDYYALHTKDQVRDAIYDLDMDEKDCGFEKVDEDEVISEYLDYKFDIEEYINDLCNRGSTHDERNIEKVIKILKEAEYLKED